jgi:hypothetical protein
MSAKTRSARPRRRALFCIGCDRITNAPTLVRVVETASGAGGMLYACPACVRRYTPRTA